MSKKIQLTIADPCNENWGNMTPAEKGRFCASCQKQVIDFTNMSDSQIATFFKKPIESLSKDGSVCGRFYNDQLDRNIEIPKKRIHWVRYFFQFALPAFLFSTRATAQGEVRAKPVLVTQTIPACSPIQGSVKRVTADQLKEKPNLDLRSLLSPGLSIRGIVLNESDEPVPYATVVIKGTRSIAVADSAGVFRIERPASQDSIVLEVSSVGYYEMELPIDDKVDITKDVLIRLSGRAIQGVVVVGYSSYTLGRVAMSGAVSVVRREAVTAIEKPKEEIPAMIKVYPNPVASGTNINVGCQKLKEGYYTIQLANQSGQQVMSKQAWIDGDTQVLNIDIPHVATGIYFLKLTNKETSKRFTQKVVIE